MTFYELLSSGYDYIQIPIIQRDYVQGRATTDRQREDRALFVHTLLDATLPDSPPCHLDFIYGSCDNVSLSESNRAFLPLDGQQRLTTLFLLHWILLKKADSNDEYDKVRWNLLKKFSYKTRIGSETFCRKLLENNIIIDNNDTLAVALRYQGWYGNDMKCDPTVQAMLDMIEAIEDALGEEKYSSSLNEMKENLFCGQCITFHLLDLDEYNLTDGLYVKMNARGKELTEFENWKAEFIEFLSVKDEEWGTDYKSRFEDSIEHNWHDLFWTDVYKEYVNSEKKRYPRIDEHFICFFLNTHRMLYFLMKGTSSKVEEYKSGTKSQQDDVFSYLSQGSPKYLDFLFDGIDWLYKVHKEKGLDSFFCSVFQNSDLSNWSDKVFLFGEGNQELNLFRQFVSQSKSQFEGNHVLLYCILKYGIKTGIVNPDNRFLEYIRNCRNHLESKSYFDHASLLIQSQVRVTDMADYDTAFEEYIASSTYKSSIRKKIEDLPYTCGNTMAFDEVIKSVEDHRLKEDLVWNAIVAFNALNTSQKVKVLLSNGFRGVMVGACGYGQRVFLGSDTSRNKDRINHWDVVFRTRESKHIKDAVNSFINRYCKGESYNNQIIKVNYPSKPIDYFFKYDDVLCAQVPKRGDNPDEAFFFYAMQNPWGDLDLISIHSYARNPLAAAYQVCPMTNAVAKKVSFRAQKGFWYQGYAAEKHGLEFWDNNSKQIFNLVFRKMEWEITIGNELLSQSIRDKYCIDDNNLLYATEHKDLIEVAVSFMEDVFQIIQEKKLL